VGGGPNFGEDGLTVVSDTAAPAKLCKSNLAEKDIDPGVRGANTPSSVESEIAGEDGTAKPVPQIPNGSSRYPFSA
jgi:hypothetical protein